MKSLALLLSLAACASADTLRSAQVTKSVNEVWVNLQTKSTRRVATGDSVEAPSSVQTGRRSRAELTFTDKTITRLGQNSLFTFRNAGRDVELERGSILLQVPKNAGGATIRTATVTAAITGTTSMCEYSPGKWVKLLTLEGTQKLFINGSKVPVLVPAGQMIVMHPDGRVVPKPVTFDLEKLIATSTLAGEEIFDPLPGPAKEAIALAVAEQLEAKKQGDLLPSNLVISGPGARGARRLRDTKTTRDPRPIPVERGPDGQTP